MEQSNKNSNSAGRATTKKRMEEILNNVKGLALQVRSSSGVLYIDIQNESGNSGYLREILSLILLLLMDGNTSVKWGLN